MTQANGNRPTGGNAVPGGWDVTNGVGITALGVAAARAVESDRADRLIDDPHAAGFVRAAAPQRPLPTTADTGGAVDADWAALVNMMAIRTRVLDELLLDAVGAGIRQVVILAAGLDARAQRLPWPSGTTVHEIDQPDVLAFKQRVLEESGSTPRCTLRSVPCDLRDDWPAALSAAGFDRTAPSVWLVEGLLPYLPPDGEAQLFDRISALAAPGSRIAVEAVDPAAADDYLGTDSVREFGGHMGFDLAELWDTRRRPDQADTLRGHGWDPRVRRFGDLAAELGRPLTGPTGTMIAEARILDAAR